MDAFDKCVTLGIALAACMVGGFVVRGCDPDYSEGERTGVVYKLSKKGLIFKSWEGEMNLGGAAQGEGGIVIPNSWAFNAEDPKVVADLNAAAKSGRRVTVRYRQWLSEPITITNKSVIQEVLP